MLRQISEEVRINLKDRLRDVRHVIRKHRHDNPVAASGTEDQASSPVRGIEGLLGHAASAFDDAMSLAESIVPLERSSGAAKGFVIYFPAEGSDPLAGERAFRRDMYQLTKTVLAKKNLQRARIHEANFAAVHAAMRKHHGDLLVALGREGAGRDRIALVASLCAALLIEFLNHHPLRFAEPAPAANPPDMDRSFEVSCLAAVALACGLATVDQNGTPEPDLLDLALLATDARLDRILSACSGSDPLEGLATIFATLIAHLP